MDDSRVPARLWPATARLKKESSEVFHEKSDE
jgi:hypothetical protein